MCFPALQLLAAGHLHKAWRRSASRHKSAGDPRSYSHNHKFCDLGSCWPRRAAVWPGRRQPQTHKHTHTVHPHTRFAPCTPCRYAVGLGALLFGPVADKFGRRVTLLGATLATVGLSVACHYAATIESEWRGSLSCTVYVHCSQAACACTDIFFSEACCGISTLPCGPTSPRPQNPTKQPHTTHHTQHTTHTTPQC